MFDGRFDPYFYQAFVSQEEDANDLAAPVWLPAMALVGGLGLLAAACLALLR
jgi:hypothetical protein